jgi:hypothetical protein
VRVLPARPHLVHHVAEGNAAPGIGEAERTARAEVPAERHLAGADRPFGLVELEAEAEAGRRG